MISSPRCEHVSMVKDGISAAVQHGTSPSLLAGCTLGVCRLCSGQAKANDSRIPSTPLKPGSLQSSAHPNLLKHQLSIHTWTLSCFHKLNVLSLLQKRWPVCGNRLRGRWSRINVRNIHAKTKRACTGAWHLGHYWKERARMQS
jgi:hypothetical protein